MATYQNIKGLRVKYLSSDPPSPREGEVWYNSTTGTVKGYVLGLGSFSSGGTANTARNDIFGNVGTQTSSLLGGGGADTPTGSTSNTETYDGSTWTEVNNRSTSFFRVVNSGTQTAALGYGGYSPSAIPTAPERYSISTEEWDGTNWTAGGNFPTGIQTAGGTGVQTASLQASGIYGPYSAPSPPRWKTEINEYDGSSWSNGGAMPAGRDLSAVTGIQTAAIMVGGRGPGGTENLNAALYYDGSSWTSQPNYPISGHAIIGSGTQTAAIFAGGAAPTRTTNANTWDGSAYSATGSMSTARSGGVGGGTTTAALVSTGATPGGSTAAVEEYDAAVLGTKTLTTS
jgi:hypothetical protein